ncbi:MAG: hypothetical protein QXJ95_05540 [Ignisphaera sp.]|uniref:Uncharacterized protein n=1 Tax=Ignisphaera aggregans TaxID=334771 RepID=A0A7J3JQB2_9CREN
MAGRVKYMCRIFEKRYGIVGHVAKRYIMAGYSVEFMHPTRYGPIHIVARKGGQKIAIEIFDRPSIVPMDTVSKLLEKARRIGARPVLALYSDGPRMDSEVYRYCTENGIRIRRIRG